ncbi:ribosomal biogenesis protein LAS1L [Spea bombifrons]|uniref:ribosomal biogenesis protein LAS1L n=1 Tax=Spea bombifrons TaxID=233779 RepID=UPI00234A2C80|nr:ribosomal biogenesis protein LAS1L [Spea bombifrons]
MAARRQVVAWLSKAEWEQVLEYLYSRDCKLQRDALHRISAWKSRYGNRMPLAVECTADLVRCKILDMSGGMEAEELVLLYGLALVRFVNLITERKQKTVSIPLRRLANELKIPEWVVTLRHDVTHGKLPKLSMCRKGWDCVMEWLRREYWSRQLGNSETPQWVEDEESLSEEAEEVQPQPSYKEQKHQALAVKLRETLHSYTREQFKIFQELLQDPKAKKQWSATSDLEWTIAQAKDSIRQSSAETAAEILLEDGFLIPTAKQLVTLKIDQEDFDENLHLPRMLFRVWQPLLKVLHSQDFTQELLEKMFSALGLCGDADIEQRAHYLSCWISEVLTANHRADRKCMIPSRNQTAVKSKWKLFPNRVGLKWRKLLQKCLESPCQATPQLLKLIFEYMKPSLPSDTQEKLLCLCSIYIQDDDSDGSMDYSDQPIYTVESLEWRLKQESKGRANNSRVAPAMEEDEEQTTSEHTEDEEMITQESYEDEYIQVINMKMATERRAVLQGSSWGISTEYVKWGEYPLGLVPGQSEDPGCLLVDSYSIMSVLEQQCTESKKNGNNAPTSSTTVAGASFEPILWSQAELNNIKAGLKLF